MLTAMYSGVSGLNVHGRALSSVADNIANLNTHSYKSTRTNFGDVMVHSLTVGGSVVEQVGTGARVLNVQNMMTQGSFESTDIPTDLAVNGKGWFEVSNPNTVTEGNQGTFYTRAGQFTMDKEGYLVNPQGMRLRGYNIDANGDLEQIVEDLQILTMQTDAIPTEQVDLSINLDAEDSNEYHPSLAIDPTDKDTWNYMTTVRVYDSLGIGHDMSMLFQKLSTYGGASPSGSSSVWKASVFENQDGTMVANPTHPDNTFYTHFDTDGHMVGISTGQPGYGDMYTSTGTVTATSSAVSDRAGGTLGFSTTEGGSQAYYSSYTVSGFGTAWSSGDSITIGGTSYDQATYGTLSALVDAINSTTGTNGIYATNSGGTLGVYSASNPAAISITDATTTGLSGSGDTLTEVVSAINNGDNATGLIDISGAAVGDAITVGTTTYTQAAVYGGLGSNTFTNQAQLVAEINNDVAGLASAAGANGVFLQGPATGTTYNYSLSATGGAQVSGSAMVGGMDDNSTTMVTASAVSSGSGYALRLARNDASPDSTSTITLAANNTLGDTLSIDYDTWTQDQYAADAQSTSTVGTEGEYTLEYDFPDATADQEITFDFTPTDSSNSTQSAGASETFYLYQDGSPRGALQSLDIDQRGLITGQFSNGTLRTMGAVMLVNFANNSALEREGENLWSKTLNSGEPVHNRPGQGGLGTIESGALEQSNVDLANEFVKMINYQRAFQANSRTISTTDQMLAELINLKR
jgi:flagellar hook protein FlgE